MDTECEQLRDRALEAEGERDELQGVVEDFEAEKDKLAVELDSKQVRYFVNKRSQQQESYKTTEDQFRIAVSPKPFYEAFFVICVLVNSVM